MTPPDPARIAAGLTWSQRDELREIPMAGAKLSWKPSPSMPAGLIEPFDTHVYGLRMRRLTDLGRAVRAALAAGSRAGNTDDGDVR